MIKKFFTGNINYKVAAILLALALKFYFISPRNQIQDTVKVPVSIVNMPKTLAIISPRDWQNLSTVITVKGPRSMVEQYKGNPREIKVPLMYLSQKPFSEEGFAGNANLQHYVDLKSYVNIPSGLELEGIDPPGFKLTLDKNYNKNVVIEVKNNLIGELEPGYELKSVTVSPSSVILTGPTLEIGKIKKINTEKIDIASFTGPQEFHVMLETIDDLITYNVEMVKVNLDIVLKTKVKRFSRVPLRVIVGDCTEEKMVSAENLNKQSAVGKSNVVTITPAYVGVGLKIREDEYDNVKQDDVQIVVETSLLPPGEHLVEPRLKEADGRFTLVETTPAKVSVKIKE